MSEKLEGKIRYLCNKFPTKEWSGTLFYTIEGKFEDNSLIIVGQDFFLMDIGSAGYTEYDTSPDIVSYICEYPELMSCYTGLLHSHNAMAK